jgi:hypothetical protein
MPTPLSDLSSPLVFRRNFNRFSARNANSCAGCHNIPITGGTGDIVANVFVLGQRFDSITMDHNDGILTRGAPDESGNFVNALNFADSRATPGMFGSGYLELGVYPCELSTSFMPETARATTGLGWVDAGA